MWNDKSRMPTLAWVAIVLVLVFVGWVAKTTVAQDRRQKIPTTAAAADTSTTPPSLSDDLDVPSIKAAEAAKPNLPLATESQPGRLSLRPSRIKCLLILPRGHRGRQRQLPWFKVGNRCIPDPEKAALVFVAENQKLAESQLKNLKDEESKLNARLLKVQAGIKRWESLVERSNKAKEVSRSVPRSPTSRIVSPNELAPAYPGSDSSIVPK